jgi:hypothetical protein
VPVRAALVCGLLLLGAASSSGQALSATPGSTPPPSELAGPIAALLAPASLTVSGVAAPLELWWVKTVPLEKPPASGKPSWADVADGTLVGAIRVGAAWSDIRGYGMKPGVYTLRFALQPQNGDHLGVSPNREFLLVCPSALDTTPDPLGYKGTVDLAKQTIRRSHPSALSLDPPAATASPLSPVSNDLGLSGLVFSVPAAASGQAAGALTFGLILKGSIQN